MKKTILLMLLSLSQLQASNYLITLDDKHYKNVVVEKPVETDNNQNSNISEFLTPYISSVSEGGAYRYNCTNALDCVEDITANTQSKSRTLYFTYNLTESKKIRSFDWVYNRSSPNTNKYPRNVEVFYKDNTGNWVSAGITSGIVRTNSSILEDLSDVINIPFSTDIPESDSYRFKFTGSTDPYSYTWIQYFRVKT